MTAKLQAPITVDLKIKITNDTQIGEVTIGMPMGRYITEQELRDRVAQFEKEEMPEGFRLMNKREWFDSVFGLCHDGEDDDGNPQYLSYAMPGGDEWDE
ncbi:hypothetical protein E8K88_01435 [Lampropedia aestuarii]|uniref:Uncharacterized protein n=1 Tax=Lampropedia aestuarii TaxID=2562762 RepID=A0A4S5BTI7_9BURK|nr:hypothetical protein [Lampropedia aestuarii]MDH5857757.1 hypothetical protein [Lampropedia aestuarii]THJ35970.1 hypothetical protein E8K88_01435 [Lampropedia aestuarii]